MHTCQICNQSFTGIWSDLHGEAMCSVCGTPYQLTGGTEEMKAEGKYPYINLLPEFIPIVKEYYEETGRFTRLGMVLTGPRPELFLKWLDDKHPEIRS